MGNNEDSKQVINKHLSHEDDIDVGKDEQIVEIERKLSMRMRRRQRVLMRMKIKLMRMTLTLEMTVFELKSGRKVNIF